MLVFISKAPPTGSPVITGYDGSTRFFGNTVVLTCTVTGGIPLATLSLTCKDTPVPGTVLGTMTYTVSIDSSYNGQRCSCTASHPTWTVNKGVHSQMFVVHYPPTVNRLVSGYDGSVRYRGDRVTLTCQVSGGSPLATLSWTCDGQPQNVNPSISGTTVTSVLTLILQKGHNGKTCTCHGRHSDTRYTPYISSRTFIVYCIYTSTSTPFPWIEAGNGTLECKSQPGNPSTITYQWIRENVVIQGQTGDSLVITSLTRNDNKNSYKCKVSNDCTVHKNEDLMSRPTVLDVEYPPSIPAIQFPSSVKEGEEVTMVCRAQGVPDQYIYNGWTQIYRNQIIRSTNDFSTLSQNKRNLTLSGVSYQDIGTYRCSANNGIPDKDGEPNQTDEKYLNIELFTYKETIQLE
ncbi:hypothetical protein KUTeg_006288 [Tegillarca granosa]|uniref:Ig-like domain-containing protein n=1 Tax=Tegillarca granosa TaxID=220873 RepID=A0ABQ9FG52_TEGGR|nr:hypothetical protein KUTeg_006288 [Tegillarca granosa]